MQGDFDDPVLKSAVKRAWGKETAPPQLRARVESALAREVAKSATRAKYDWRRSPLVGLAAAAIILIAAGFIFNFYENAPPGRVKTLPNDLATEMVDAHDRALAQVSHHNLSGVPVSDLDKVRQTLKEKLGHPVLVASLGDDWRFEGASITKIGEREGAQLVFTRGSETVSIVSVSIAGREYAPMDGTDYQQTWNGHPMAGVTRGGAVHCIIGSRESKLDEKVLVKLRNKIAKLVAMNEPSSDCADKTPAAARAGLGL